jgi:malonate transporter and related proteins
MDFTNLTFTINIVAPIFIIIFLGFIFKKLNLINEAFASVGSKLVFNIALPTLIFLKLITVDIKSIINYKQLAFCYFGTILVYIIAWIISKYHFTDGKDRGVFIQGCFRGNYAIIGLPLIYNLFGDSGIVNAAIVLIGILPLNNILAVIALTVPSKKENNIKISKILFKIITNPLIIAPVLALPFSIFQIPIHLTLIKTGNYLANLTIPLALLSIGASLHFKDIKKELNTAVASTIIKIIIMPITLTFIAIKLGFSGINLGSIFFLFATPTAVASYIMADAMNSNSKLASTIVIMTTSLSVITISIGIYILTLLNYF